MNFVHQATSAVDYGRLEGTPFTRERLNSLHCVVVGAGALGNEVTRVLGLLGPARITIVDPDVVEPSNLPRSFFFWGRNAIGQNKASALVQAAAGFFSNSQWSAIGSEIADVGFQRIAEANVLFSCVDSDLARLEMAYISSKLHIPMIDGGLGRQNYSHGRVTYFPGTAESACFGCLLSPSDRRELLELWQANLRPCGGISAAESDEGDLVSTPTMASVIGAIQVEFGLRNLFQAQEGMATKSTTLELRLQPDRWISEFTTSMRPDCPFHEDNNKGSQWKQTLHLMPQPDCTIQEFLDSVAAECVVLDWPVCAEAKCLACDKKWSPMLRLAALRRKGHCPSCGSRKILELQTIRTLGRDSRCGSLTAAELGLPTDHLFTVRSHSSIQ